MYRGGRGGCGRGGRGGRGGVEMWHVNVGIVGRTDCAVTTEGSVAVQSKGISLRLHWKTAWEATCAM